MLLVLAMLLHVVPSVDCSHLTITPVLLLNVIVPLLLVAHTVSVVAANVPGTVGVLTSILTVSLLSEQIPLLIVHTKR